MYIPLLERVLCRDHTLTAFKLFAEALHEHVWLQVKCSTRSELVLLHIIQWPSLGYIGDIYRLVINCSPVPRRILFVQDRRFIPRHNWMLQTIAYIDSLD